MNRDAEINPNNKGNMFDKKGEYMKLIVLGSTGMLGRAIYHKAKEKGFFVIGIATHNADINLDITNDIALINLIKDQRPDIIINACAVISHKICEERPDLAYRVNARPSSILANLSNEIGFYYIFISTDGYYCGDSNKKHTTYDDVLLLNEYVRTKYAGECFSCVGKKNLIIRTNIVGYKGIKQNPTFVEWAIDNLANHRQMTLFDDYYVSSITVSQFSEVLFDLLHMELKGILNLASSDVYSKKDFIESLANEFNFDLENIKVESVNILSPRRANSLGLDVTYAEQQLGYKLPTLKEVVLQLKKEHSNSGLVLGET
jgi:dTDP-4-dehydrorhamnose reductase